MMDESWQKFSEKIGKSLHLAFEWSIKIQENSVVEREKVLCWIRNREINAHEEINFIRSLHPNNEYFNSLSNQEIKNVGFCLSQHDDSLYIHSVDQLKKDKYIAFKQDQQQTYEFHYLPCTPDGLYPENVLKGFQKELYNKLLNNDEVRALSGFWLRKEGDTIQQISLLLPHRPTIRSILHYFPKHTQEKLAEHRNYLLKYIAFNNDDSFTLYFSAKINHFPKTFDEVKQAVNIASIEERDKLFALTKNISPGTNRHYVSMDDFYSTVDIESWKKLLGPQLFYHFGLFQPKESIENIWDDSPFVRGMVDICQHINQNEKVYDLGCGYGAVSKYLIEEKNCDVLAATISKSQFQYCGSLGIKTRYADMESTYPPGIFDTILLYESFEHVMNKPALLKKLQRFTKKLIIRTSTSETGKHNIVYGGSMNLVRSDYIVNLLVKLGYKVKLVVDRRDETKQTFEIWKKRLDAVEIVNDNNYDEFKKFVDNALFNLDEWQLNHRLIDIVAYT